MKIKKGNHSIKLVQEVDPKRHVPLGYLYGDKKVYDCNIIQEHPATGIRQVIPYERFDSYEKVFFESFKASPESLHDLIPIDSGKYIKRDQYGYYYEPETSVRFEPHSFFYTVLGQRTQTYTTQTIYNLSVSCIEKTKRLTDALIQIFADAPERGLVRENVWINNKDLSSTSLANSKFSQNDFLFIETKNGDTFTANDEKIDYEALFKEHANIWLCCSDINLLEKGTSQLNKSILYHEKITSDTHNFLSSSFNDSALPPNGKTITFFEGNVLSCIIKQYDSKGFIIISSDQLIEKASQHYKLIYEILMQIFLQSYVETAAISGYVCDDPIDYIVKRNKVLKAQGFRSEKPYYELFNSYNPNDYKLISVNPSSEFVKVSHSPDYIYFVKDGGPVLPKKGPTDYAILLENQEVAYINTWHYIANTQISYKTEQKEDYIEIQLEPFCLNHAYNPKRATLKASLIETVDYEKKYIESGIFYVVYLNGLLYCMDKRQWNNKGIVLLSVYVYLTKAPIELIDMRVRGGGLPENKKDNYDLLDIGHLQGRPFRKSGAYVIRLPIEARVYHDAIMKELQKISVADRFFSVIYEKRNDDLESN